MGDTGGDLLYSHMSVGQLSVLLILILFLTCHSFLIAITGMFPVLLTIKTYTNATGYNTTPSFTITISK